MRVIYLYTDSGAGEKSLAEAELSLNAVFADTHRIERINAPEVIRGTWTKDAALFVMPGGRDLPYLEKLNGEGNLQIRTFVAGGGSYLGFCAGAYYGASRIEFEVGTPLEITGERELRFYSGAAIGPAFGANTYDYDSPQDARLAEIVWRGEERSKIYYSGGCYFSEPGPDTETTVLARYIEVKDCPPAAILSQVDRGKAVLCGIHPEFRGETLKARGEDRAEVVNSLIDFEEERLRFFIFILDSLGVRAEV